MATLQLKYLKIKFENYSSSPNIMGSLANLSDALQPLILISRFLGVAFYKHLTDKTRNTYMKVSYQIKSSIFDIFKILLLLIMVGFNFNDTIQAVCKFVNEFNMKFFTITFNSFHTTALPVVILNISIRYIL